MLNMTKALAIACIAAAISSTATTALAQTCAGNTSITPIPQSVSLTEDRPALRAYALELANSKFQTPAQIQKTFKDIEDIYNNRIDREIKLRDQRLTEREKEISNAIVGWVEHAVGDQNINDRAELMAYVNACGKEANLTPGERHKAVMDAGIIYDARPDLQKILLSQ